MRVVNKSLIAEIIDIKTDERISTSAAMQLVVERGIFKADELPEVHIMEALIKGLKKKNGYPARKLTDKRLDEIINHIEESANCELPAKSKEMIKRELAAAYQLNGLISDNYINRIIEAYKEDER